MHRCVHVSLYLGVLGALQSVEAGREEIIEHGDFFMD